ncbi:polyhydroxyalkanoate depolymerase [Mangrovicella endophytica]|uniref:polyhydroxyalkanoate depolymerase n=1 Tax=Mangrovicella endophytica TaxID=2066697 RepID=UPI000C9E08BE|nr:polyhydroxyalkanoate depolymerase [Mangrovicella endophytica]
MLYELYEWNHALLAPLRAAADATRLFYQNPLNPFSSTEAGRTIAAMAELFERTTRVYGKPEFGIYETVVGGLRVPVQDHVVWEKPFGRLLHFQRELPKGRGADPRFLIVAPMSGHYATLLRGTVEALLPYGDVHITDWEDARKVPLAAGRFDLDDYVDYVMEMLEFIGPDTHVIAVCQPAVPVIMAVARMEAEENPCSPSTMTLMGGPIDTRVNPTAVNRLAMEKGLDWFRDNVVMKVPFPQPGFMRDVYPGFLQLSGFMSMNLDRHVIAHKDFFFHLVRDDGDSADKHREFYDEYLAVMDMTAEFYLQTVDSVFIHHRLPKGEMTHRGAPVDLTKIRKAALLTVEGENDDISGVGQTEAAQHLCTSIPDDRRVHYVQPKVGHYGVFNGSRFRAEIAPRIVDFALTHGTTHAAAALPRKSPKLAEGPVRQGAVEEREAKADALKGGTAAAGETGLGVVAAGPAAADEAASAAPNAAAEAFETMTAAAPAEPQPGGASVPQTGSPPQPAIGSAAASPSAHAFESEAAAGQTTAETLLSSTATVPPVLPSAAVKPKRVRSAAKSEDAVPGPMAGGAPQGLAAALEALATAPGSEPAAPPLPKRPRGRRG